MVKTKIKLTATLINFVKCCKVFQQNTEKLCKTPEKYMSISCYHKIAWKTRNWNKKIEGRIRKLNQSNKCQIRKTSIIKVRI